MRGQLVGFDREGAAPKFERDRGRAVDTKHVAAAGYARITNHCFQLIGISATSQQQLTNFVDVAPQ